MLDFKGLHLDPKDKNPEKTAIKQIAVACELAPDFVGASATNPQDAPEGLPWSGDAIYLDPPMYLY